LLQQTSICIYPAHFFYPHFPNIEDRIVRQLAMVLDEAQLQLLDKIHQLELQIYHLNQVITKYSSLSI